MPEVQLSWTDNSISEDGFYIYRSAASNPSFPGNYSQIGSVGANVTSYTDTNPPAPDTVYYIVTAYNQYGESDLEQASGDTYAATTYAGQTRRSLQNAAVYIAQTSRNAFVIGIAKQFVSALGEVRPKEAALGEVEQRKSALGSTTNDDETDQQEEEQ